MIGTDRSLRSILGVSGGFVEGREGARFPLNPPVTRLDEGERPFVAIWVKEGEGPDMESNLSGLGSGRMRKRGRGPNPKPEGERGA